jgi:threonine aldolase
MREAMARAEVGDEQIGDDPTVNLLCERVADLLGKEAAVFMPSGTMCNVAATLAHCRPWRRESLAHVTAAHHCPRRRRACRTWRASRSRH